jgi:O-methyltransferase involved in polyketide biosynthesis
MLTSAEQKSKIAFVLPDVLQQEFREQIAKDGYDMRGKSRWVAEGIEHLLGMRNYPELVRLSTEMKGFGKMESVVVSKDLKKEVDLAVIEIRKIYPSLEGVQSGIVRTAIVQRLLRS